MVRCLESSLFLSYGEEVRVLNPIQIEEIYKKFAGDLPSWAHDGILSVDLQFLHDQGLLYQIYEEEEDLEDLTQYFHVIENPEKVTLFNEQFLVWIIPKMDGEQPVTYVLIALQHPNEVSLEIVYMTKGVYNTPRHVLNVLQHFLLDTLENEATVTAFEKNA